MTPKTISNVSELNKEFIGEMYIRSLSNPETRKLHPGLSGKRDGPSQVGLSVHELAIDFTGWYSGVFSTAHALDTRVDLPPVAEMVTYITQQKFEPAKNAIAA